MPAPTPDAFDKQAAEVVEMLHMLNMLDDGLAPDLARDKAVINDSVRLVADALRAAAADATRRERERCAKIAREFRGGFTANIRASADEQELVRDPDGPWVLGSAIADAIGEGPPA